MKYLFRVLIITLFVVTNAGKASAETTDSLSERLDAVEKITNQINKVSKWMPHISGYISVGYTYDDDVSSFDVRNARIDVNGKLPAKFDYRILVDVYKFKTYDARLRYMPMNELNVCAGQFKVPFTIGNLNGPLQEELIDYPLVIRQLVHGALAGESTTGRDVGISLFGSVGQRKNYCLLEYAVGVFNGNGMVLKDNNKSKDLSGRIMIHPLEGLTLSGSYYWGERNVEYTRTNRWSAGLGYKHRLGFLRSEYVEGETGNTTSRGWYATLGANLPKHITPVVRYDYFNSSTNLDEIQRNYTIGIDYHPIKFLRFQLNYCRNTYNAASEKNDGNQIKMVVMGIL